MEISIYRKYQEYTVLIDEEDFPVVRKLNLFLTKSLSGKFYVMYYDPITKKNNLLHRLITRAKPRQIIDHIDQNPLNNMKSNLRFATRSQNGSNTIKYKNNTSGYKGVTFDKSKGKYKVQIRHKGIVYHLGRSDDPEELAHIYDSVSSQLQGEFASPNFI